MYCYARSLPFPSGTMSHDAEEVNKKNKDNVNMMNKFLMVGCDQSGTSTIFKQASHIWGNASLYLFKSTLCMSLLIH